MPALPVRSESKVIFATEQVGTVPAADPRLLDGVIFGQLGVAPEAGAFYSELTGAAEFSSTVAWYQAREMVTGPSTVSKVLSR